MGSGALLLSLREWWYSDGLPQVPLSLPRDAGRCEVSTLDRLECYRCSRKEQRCTECRRDRLSRILERPPKGPSCEETQSCFAPEVYLVFQVGGKGWRRPAGSSARMNLYHTRFPEVEGGGRTSTYWFVAALLEEAGAVQYLELDHDLPSCN